MKNHKVIAAVATALIGLGSVSGIAGTGVAHADTSDPEWYPVPQLKAAETGPQPGSACMKNGERREFVELTDSFFAVEGKVSTSNTTEEVVPLKQTLSETKKKSWTWSATVTVKLTDEIKKKYEWEYNREMFWSMGQNVGPYDLLPGEHGTLAWGFIMDSYTSQAVVCRSGQWTPVGRLQSGSAPRERHVEVAIQQM